jgi:hypothetical protein
VTGGRGDDYFLCPHCGAELPPSARSCPECGSDEETGWSEDADTWRAGAPTGYADDDGFDYEEFLRREFGRRRPWYGDRKRLLRLVVALVLGAALLALLLGR